MNRKLEGLFNATLTVGGLLLVGWCVGRAQERSTVQVMQGEPGRQVVLESIPTTDGKMWVRSKTPLYLRLVPKNVLDHFAPLPPHTLMICREADFKDEMQENHVGFVCGMDSYALQALGFSGGTEGDTERNRNLGVPAGQLQ